MFLCSIVPFPSLFLRVPPADGSTSRHQEKRGRYESADNPCTSPLALVLPGSRLMSLIQKTHRPKHPAAGTALLLLLPPLTPARVEERSKCNPPPRPEWESLSSSLTFIPLSPAPPEGRVSREPKILAVGKSSLCAGTEPRSASQFSPRLMWSLFDGQIAHHLQANEEDVTHRKGIHYFTSQRICGRSHGCRLCCGLSQNPRRRRLLSERLSTKTFLLLKANLGGVLTISSYCGVFLPVFLSSS